MGYQIRCLPPLYNQLQADVYVSVCKYLVSSKSFMLSAKMFAKLREVKPVARCRPRGGHLPGISFRQDSNLQPAAYKTAALPSELQKHIREK